MKNSPYKIDEGSSKFLSALGSGAVAVGSVATAIVIVVPGMPGYELIANGIESTGVGIIPNADPAGDENSLGESEASFLSSDGNSVSAAATLISSSLSSAENPPVSDSPETPGSPLAAAPAPAPSVSEPGNTSSPTPGGGTWSGGSSAGNGTSLNNDSGNTTSPTPAAGEYDDDDDDEDDDDEDDDDEDDDDEDDDDEDDDDEDDDDEDDD